MRSSGVRELRQMSWDNVVVQTPAPRQLDGRDDGPFLVQLGGQRQGPGGHAAHVGVVAAGGNERREFFLAFLSGVDRGDHGDVGQVGAAEVWVIENDDVAGTQRVGVDFQRGTHRRRHRAEVHGHVGRLRHHVALGVENRAGEVATFLDVRRIRGALEGNAHFLGHRLEHVLEDFQADGVNGHRAPLLLRATCRTVLPGYRGAPHHLSGPSGRIRRT